MSRLMAAAIDIKQKRIRDVRENTCITGWVQICLVHGWRSATDVNSSHGMVRPFVLWLGAIVLQYVRRWPSPALGVVFASGRLYPS